MRDRLIDIYDRLLERYGPRDWWPADSRFEVMVGAILVQNTAWSNAAKAIHALSDAGLLSPQALRSADEADIAQLIYSSGYYNMKARKLKALVEWLGERDDDIQGRSWPEDPATLREELLGIHGIGDRDRRRASSSMPSTCPSSSSTTTPSACSTASALRPRREPYTLYQRLFTDHLPPDVPLFNEYHALIVTHAANTCKKEPACGECCLRPLCPTGKART